MGIFCGCFRRRSLVNPYPKPGYARMVEAKQPPPYCSLPPGLATVSLRRASWETERADEDARLLPPHLLMIDEKEPLEPPQVESTASSPRSSTISLPSTGVAALTVTTDNTGASYASQRSQESGVTTSGAPPSYRSRRSASQRYSNRSSWDRHHPVLAEDWFDQFWES